MAEVLKQHMISTDDNPYNPFKKFDEWLAYDQMHGHHSLELLARKAKPCDGLTAKENNAEIERAIDEIVSTILSVNANGLVHYIKVTEE